jgi:hypothetical protein
MVLPPRTVVLRYPDPTMGLCIAKLEIGTEYAEAIDVEGMHTYTETDTPIEDEELSDSEALSINKGRDNNEPADGE